MGALNSSLILLFEALAGLYLLAILLRFLLQIARADFYNPVSQAVVKATDPTVRLFRSFIPGYRGVDFSCLILALVVEALAICVLGVLYGYGIPGPGSVVTMSVVGVLLFIIRIYYYAIIGSIIMSFVMMFSGNMNPHPMLQLIWQLTEPVMGPVRRVVPPMGGLDFSPIFIFIGIQLLQNLIISGFGVTVGQAQLIIGV
jgi:YggT family protein